ncbi:MAG: hypothetical protein ACREMS_13655 [Gemmatimonadaceae bacterium]
MPSVEKTLPYPLPGETSRVYGLALHDAVRSSVESMDELHDCLKPCVVFLREVGVGPVQMILSIKACTRQCALNSQALGDEFALANANMLMEQIVKWAIVEYFRTA